MHQMKLDNNVFFTTKKHKMIRKISWKVRRMLAVKAASMIFFRVISCLFVVKKELFFTLHFSHSGWRDCGGKVYLENCNVPRCK